MSRRRLALAVAAALVLLAISVAVGSSLVSSPSSRARKPPPATASPAATSTPEASPPARPAGFVSFDAPESGFSIAYPSSWKRLEPSDKEVRLLATNGTKASLLVRVNPVGISVTKETLPLTRELTDSLVRADRRVELLSQPQPITLDGLPGYRYLYTFGAGAGPDGPRGAHVHYFVFQDKRLISIVLQVPGLRALKRNLGALDRIVGTFDSLGVG